MFPTFFMLWHPHKIVLFLCYVRVNKANKIEDWGELLPPCPENYRTDICVCPETVHFFLTFLLFFPFVCVWVCVCVHTCVLSPVRLFATPWTVACQTSLSMDFSRQGGGCHFLLQGIFLMQGSNLHLLHWQADSLPLRHLGSPIKSLKPINFRKSLKKK